MPQLIAMVIVVVGAMIYMFQTFGGTGDKIEGVAQKSSIITEINNIKDGLKIAGRSEQIAASPSGDQAGTLSGLAVLSYFAEQINEQIINNADTTAYPTNADNNVYYAISFGGENPTDVGGMALKLVTKAGYVPGIYVDLSVGSLSDNTAFLESQIAKDLETVAFIDRHATSTTAGADAASGSEGIDSRLPQASSSSTNSLIDGKFIVYFKDFGSNEVVK